MLTAIFPKTPRKSGRKNNAEERRTQRRQISTLQTVRVCASCAHFFRTGVNGENREEYWPLFTLFPPVQNSVVLVAAVALVDNKDRVLLAQRPEGKSMAGLWEFPGGKIEEGETPEFTLMRELEEELGIETRECRT